VSKKSVSLLKIFFFNFFLQVFSFNFFENFGTYQILVRSYLRENIPQKLPKNSGIKCLKYSQICPKKVILCQNHGILAKYVKIWSTKLGSFYSEFSESQKKYWYAQKSITWKIWKSIFCLSLARLHNCVYVLI